MTSSPALLRQYIRSIILERGHGKKPGGPRTNLGALHQLNPDSFRAKISSAMSSAEGNVEDAADDLDVASRTLYHYLETEPSLDSIQTTKDIEDDDDKKRHVGK